MVVAVATARAVRPDFPCCPACQSTTVTKLWHASSAEAAQHFVLREADRDRHERLRRHVETLWQGEQCAVMECGSCGLGFAWPFVSGDAAFYDLAYGSTTYPAKRWEFERTKASLRQIPMAGRVLEIGAGTGAFLDMLTPPLPRSAIVAAEYNEESRRALREKGYHAISADLRSPSFDPGPFDVVFMFHVLEHMDRLAAVFDKLRTITAEGAHLFIAVPNPLRIRFNERCHALRDMPPNHISAWTPAAFQSVVEPHGFAIIEIERERCSLTSLAQEDAISRYLRWSQKPGSLANRLRSMSRSRARRWAEFALIAGVAPMRLGIWASAAQSLGELGVSLWLHLRKEA